MLSSPNTQHNLGHVLLQDLLPPHILKLEARLLVQQEQQWKLPPKAACKSVINLKCKFQLLSYMWKLYSGHLRPGHSRSGNAGMRMAAAEPTCHERDLLNLRSKNSPMFSAIVLRLSMGSSALFSDCSWAEVGVGT